MVDNVIDVVELSFVDDGVESQTVTNGSRTTFRGMSVESINDDRSVGGPDDSQNYDLITSSDGAQADTGDGVVNHRTVRVPLDVSTDLFIDNFFTNTTLNFNRDKFQVFERYRTDTDIIYDVFYLSTAPTGAIDLALNVITRTGEPGDTFPTYSTLTDHEWVTVVLRSVQGNVRTWDIFQLELT